MTEVRILSASLPRSRSERGRALFVPIPGAWLSCCLLIAKGEELVHCRRSRHLQCRDSTKILPGLLVETKDEASRRLFVTGGYAGSCGMVASGRAREGS